MHALRLSLCLIAGSACGSTDSGSSGTAETSTTPATGTSAAPTTHASVGSTSDVTGSTAATEAGASSTASPTTSGAHDTHDEATTHSGPPVADYCNCMLENCHDQYHELWGEEHRASEAMCKAAAEAVPSAGMPAMSGDSLECRLHFCTIGHDDPVACASALGAAPCA